MAPPLLQRPLLALLLFFGFVAALKGDKNKGSGFTYPVQEGLTFYEKDSVNVSWTTQFKSASLLVFCWGGAKEDELNMKANWDNVPGNNGSYLLVIDYGTTANKCWFNLRDNEKDSQDVGINSAGFSLSKSERSQTTLGLGGKPSTTLAKSATKAPAATTVTVPASPIPTGSNSTGGGSGESISGGSSSDGLSSGAKAGIGIGVALGAVGLLALGGAFWLVKRKRNKTAADALPSEKDKKDGETTQDSKPQELPAPVPGPPPQQPRIAEIDSRQAPAELPA